MPLNSLPPPTAGSILVPRSLRFCAPTNLYGCSRISSFPPAAEAARL